MNKEKLLDWLISEVRIENEIIEKRFYMRFPKEYYEGSRDAFRRVLDKIKENELITKEAKKKNGIFYKNMENKNN